MKTKLDCNKSNDIYSDFKELKQYEKQGQDYKVEYHYIKKSPFLLMAIHGGKIEFLTDEIAKDIAANRYSFYSFEGIKPRNNAILHITATCFDEPNALKLAKKSETIISIHGCKDNEAIVQIGGLDSDLILIIKKTLQKSGFTCSACNNSEISGNHKLNICNRGKRKKGVQIELSSGLRKQFLKNGIKTSLYYQFIDSIKEALSEYNKNHSE